MTIVISLPRITRRKYKNTHTNTLIIKFCFLAALRGLDSPTLTISVMDVAHGLVIQQVLLSSRFVFVVLYSFPCLPLGERRKKKTRIFSLLLLLLCLFLPTRSLLRRAELLVVQTTTRTCSVSTVISFPVCNFSHTFSKCNRKNSVKSMGLNAMSTVAYLWYSMPISIDVASPFEFLFYFV